MKAHIKTSFILSFLLSFLLICLPQSHVNAQDFLKKFLSNSSIKSGKQLKSDGDYPSAIKAFTKSIKRKPENLEAYYQLGLIFEEVLHDYDKAISLYKNVIIISEGVKPTGTDEELKVFNSLIKDARTSIDRTIGKKFESIEKPKIPVYIMVKPYQKILTEPKMFSYSKYKTTSYASEFKLLDFSDNWYQINVPSIGPGWINGKNVLTIIQKEKKAIETSPTGKAALYQRFAELYPDSSFALEARDEAVSISYELARDENTINSYSTYLKKYPDSKYSDEVQLKKDELTFEDESFFNNMNRLRHWITNNPESTFIEEAKKRIDELTFAQAKYGNNTVSLEGYIIDFPDGQFVSEAKQLIENIKHNHARFKDTIYSYKKYLDEYPDGRYADDAVKSIDEKEFSFLLNSQDIELLVEHLKDETNEERVELVKNRIEELYFKKADGTSNDVDAIKMHEDYLQKYPDGIYVKEAETRIEELSFNIASKTNTKDAYHDFIKRYPQSKHYKEAIDGIEVLDFNVALAEDTPESFKKFLMTYSDGEFAQMAKKRIEELAFEDAKTKDTIKAYKEFTTEYPDSHLVVTAKNIIETGYFESASLKGTVKAYKEYVELYPDGSHLEKALLIIDMLTFKPYDEKGSVRGLKKFIKKYPDNRFVKEARARIDQLNFEYYQKKNTLNAYKKFVRKYPDNRYVNEARQKIILLQTSSVGGESDSGFPYLLTIIIFSGVGIAIAGVLKRKRIVTIVRSWQQGDWSCKCGTKHNRDVENCSVCENTRPKFDEASLIGYAIWLREKLYAMYGKLPEKEIIAQKTKNLQAKTINTFGKVKEYHDKLEKEREEKYQKVEEEPVSSVSYTNAEFKNKYDGDKVKNINYESQTIGKTRNAGAVIILIIITFGVYYVIWYYNINKEIKVHDPDQKFSPGWATVALFFPIVNIVSLYNTADRIRKMQKADGSHDLISPGSALVWLLLFLIGYFLVVQGAINNHWYDHSKMESINR
jgi:outer membrane protein assembly factor BamD (BamD/ComL family)